MENNYLHSNVKLFRYYQKLGWQTIEQLKEEQLFWQYNEDSNSIAILVKHLWGNMLSRWTNFLESDGEKEWRNRDGEFENDIQSKAELIEKWNAGWDCLFDAIEALKEKDLERVVYIRNQGHSVLEAINRQLGHYSYHVGQMVFLGKMLASENWKSLSIPKGNSMSFNDQKFSQDRQRGHFTDDSKE